MGDAVDVPRVQGLQRGKPANLHFVHLPLPVAGRGWGGCCGTARCRRQGQKPRQGQRRQGVGFAGQLACAVLALLGKQVFAAGRVDFDGEWVFAAGRLDSYGKQGFAAGSLDSHDKLRFAAGRLGSDG